MTERTIVNALVNFSPTKCKIEIAREFVLLFGSRHLFTYVELYLCRTISCYVELQHTTNTSLLHLIPERVDSQLILSSLAMQKWIVHANRVMLTAVIVAVSFIYNFDVMNLNKYADHSFVDLLHHPRSGGLIQTIQCDVVDNLPRGWCLDIDLIPRYIDNKIVTNISTVTADESTKSFELQRYTVKGFEQCLANKTVVFIGDSRARYQYMHLGLSLKMGRFMFCPDIQQGSTYHDQEYDAECLGIASISNYQTWKDEGGHLHNITTWNHVFKHSTKILSSSSNNSNNNHQQQQLQMKLAHRIVYVIVIAQ